MGGTWSPYRATTKLHMVSQIVEDALRRVRIADIEEQAYSPTDSYDAGAAEASASERSWIAADLYARSGCCEI